MSEQLKASIGPLAQFFKRRSDFFENEAMSMAILLEQASQAPAPIESPVELVEDTTGNDLIEPYQPSNPPYVMAPEGASATPVTEENEDGVSV